ncbi:MAG TPA: response regulator [Spirochaetota bacterium]|nr:response regulator [Spirochaetota bacterium]HPS85568.1 response regulator [Spirochaetota bacterium]
MSKKIMVIDDSNAVRQSLLFTLKSAGYEVVEAANGVDALNLMREHIIGLFISDVNMPEMDGITLLKKIKEDRNYKHTPVIMLTTEAGGDMINEGKEAGARAWMIKPFQPEQLINAVKKLFTV